jgi:hypothetical protein
MTDHNQTIGKIPMVGMVRPTSSENQLKPVEKGVSYIRT